MNVWTDRFADIQTDKIHVNHVAVCGAHSGSSQQFVFVTESSLLLATTVVKPVKRRV